MCLSAVQHRGVHGVHQVCASQFYLTVWNKCTVVVEKVENVMANRSSMFKIVLFQPYLSMSKCKTVVLNLYFVMIASTHIECSVVMTGWLNSQSVGLEIWWPEVRTPSGSQAKFVRVFLSQKHCAYSLSVYPTSVCICNARIRMIHVCTLKIL